MRAQTTTVTLLGVGRPVVLELRRTPPLLRFVATGSSWDALDLLDDAPRPGEEILVGVRVDRGNYHVDGFRGGRRQGWWVRTATYRVCVDQPDDATARDTDRWRAWATETWARLESERRRE